jgi:hypothetical protein
MLFFPGQFSRSPSCVAVREIFWVPTYPGRNTHCGRNDIPPYEFLPMEISKSDTIENKRRNDDGG